MRVVYCIIALLQVCYAIKCPNITGPFVKMPDLDEKRFSYKLQITVEDLRKTLDGYEFYDHENQTISMYIDQVRGKNLTLDRKAITYDYPYNQTFVENEITGSCVVRDLNTSLPHQVTLFGYGVEEGPQNVQYAFYWNGTYNTTRQGNKTIDGIFTDHYRTCLEFENGSWIYEVDVYFSSNWTMPAGQNAPVMLKLNATNATTGSHLYTFKFSDYHTSNIPLEWRPHKPSGKICRGRKDAPKMPWVSDQHQFNSEIRSQGSIINVQEYYDYTNRFIKINLNAPVANLSSTEIHDYNQGFAYKINHKTGQCVIKPIPSSSSFDDVVTIENSTLVRMRTAAEYRKQGNFTFGGYTTYQGVSAQIWIAQDAYESPSNVKGANKSFVYQTFYMSDNRNGGKSVLLGNKEKRISLVNTTHNVTYVLEAYVFDYKDSVPMDVFDISGCYGDDMKATIIVKFPSEDIPKVLNNQKQFDQSFLLSAVKHAKIPQVRIKIAHESLNPSADKNGGGIYVWLTLLGLPNVTGDAVNMTEQLNLTTALANLKAAVQDNMFEVKLHVSNKDVIMTAFPTYWKTEEDLMMPPAQPPSPSPQPSPSGVSSGAAAGIAIAMLVVGVLLGMAFAKCRGRRRRAQYGYGTMEA